MMGESIKIGDMVHVDFMCAQYTLCHKAIVQYMPANISDSWVFKDCETGQIHHVSEGCTISKLEPGENE